MQSSFNKQNPCEKPLKLANDFYRNGNYEEACELYENCIAKGYPFLEALKQNLSRCKKHIKNSQNNHFVENRIRTALKKNILVVGHEARKYSFGAERVLQDTLASIDLSKYNIILALPDIQSDGMCNYNEYTNIVINVRWRWWDRHPIDTVLVNDYVRIIAEYKIDLVFVNTIMLREPFTAAAMMGVRSVCHVHELIDRDDDLLSYIGLNSSEIVNSLKKSANFIIANSMATYDLFYKEKSTFLVYNSVSYKRHTRNCTKKGKRLRACIISSSIRKKGVYDFLEVAQEASSLNLPIDFIYVGPQSSDLTTIQGIVSSNNLTNVYFEGYVDDIESYLKCIDIVFSLSHFAESFGRTVMEAMSQGCVVISYNYGAIPELIDNNKNGYLIEFKNPIESISILKNLVDSQELINDISSSAVIRSAEFEFSDYKFKINNVISCCLSEDVGIVDKSIVNCGCVDVTVVIPNYNYSKYLSERIDSIANQTIKPKKIIFLDDNSQDDSVDLAEELLKHTGIHYEIHVNNSNIGVYSQWAYGVSLADTEWVWIAEADDRCCNDFLEKVCAEIDNNTSIIYSQSRLVDSDGVVISTSNLAHTDAISADKWLSQYKNSGSVEVATGLMYRNTIPNVSACILKRKEFIASMHVLKKFRYCGDWALYSQMLAHSYIKYIPEALNDFRRHSTSTTVKNFETEAFASELNIVQNILRKNYNTTISDMKKVRSFLSTDYSQFAQELSNNIYSSTFDKVDGTRRIAFITTNDGAPIGGSEVLWAAAAIKYAKDGHDVIVLIKDWLPVPEIINEFKNNGIQLLYKQFGGFKKMLSMNLDLIIISTGDQDEGVEFFSQIINRNIKYVIVNQLTKSPLYWNIMHERTDSLRIAYENCSLALFTCKNNLRLMEERLGIRIPRAGVHFNPFHDTGFDSEFDSETETIHVAVPARIIYIHKGQDIILNIFSKDKWKSRNVVVNFYGHGPDLIDLKQKSISCGIKNFNFYGNMEKLSDIWKRNHLIAMPSRMEGMPIVLVSAMLSARIPVVTDIGGASEVIEDNVNGFVSLLPNSESFEDALDRAIHSLEFWPSIRSNVVATIKNYLPNSPLNNFVNRCLQIIG